MTPAACLQEEIAKIGYSAIVNDYAFSDVFEASSVDRKVLIAAFTHTPPSYRNAALAVVEAEASKASQVVSQHRALGAPILFVIQNNDVTVWQVRLGTASRQIDSARLDQLPNLFDAHRDAWSPLSIQRAKSIGQFTPQYQLDFVDSGLLPAIEGEIHTKLDHLLDEALAEAIDVRTGRPRGVKERALFRAVFRFLAAKILQDRSHALSRTWDASRIETILNAITDYYTLPPLPIRPGTTEYEVLNSVWQRICRGINFQNISADDLAFVYENTLVTPEIRKTFGTHSTPRQVAEYVVCHLDLHNYPPEQLRVYEPFAGAASFLVSALRHLRERLSPDWSDQQRHEFLIKHLAGDELDGFACEVAMLSLILADYPNCNGWDIKERNLFENNVLEAQMRAHNVILCNPPFQAFSPTDRKRYSLASTPSKAVHVLNAALDAHPLALGFVLPSSFILDKQFSQQRRRIEKLYGAVELVALPDRTFRFSDVESSLLIAREPRPPAPPLIKLRSTEVADRDRLRFLKTGETTTSRDSIRPIINELSGEIWIPPFEKLWRHLERYPRLGTRLQPSWGLQWTYHQSKAYSDQQRPGFRKGLHNARRLKQFMLQRPVWLDYRPNFVRRGYGQDWSKPKLVMNEGRLSRGPWRIGAAVDTRGLLYSQQFFGLWPKVPLTEADLLVLSAILNGPLANAFIAIHSPAKGIRASAVKQIPIPAEFPGGLAELVAEYVTRLSKPRVFEDQSLPILLSQIDALVLKAYDLPPRLERELLEFFRGVERPTAHPWSHWLPEHFQPFIPLHEYLSPEYQNATRPWIQELFKPLPAEEAASLREYLD